MFADIPDAGLSRLEAGRFLTLDLLLLCLSLSESLDVVELVVDDGFSVGHQLLVFLNAKNFDGLELLLVANEPVLCIAAVVDVGHVAAEGAQQDGFLCIGVGDLLSERLLACRQSILRPARLRLVLVDACRVTGDAFLRQWLKIVDEAHHGVERHGQILHLRDFGRLVHVLVLVRLCISRSRSSSSSGLLTMGTTTDTGACDVSRLQQRTETIIVCALCC